MAPTRDRGQEFFFLAESPSWGQTLGLIGVAGRSPVLARCCGCGVLSLTLIGHGRSNGWNGDRPILLGKLLPGLFLAPRLQLARHMTFLRQ